MNATGFAAISILAGRFSPQAFEKLRQLATNIFAERPHGENHVSPQNRPSEEDPPSRSS